MQNGDMALGPDARNGTQRGASRQRLSPELRELMHMLSSLEHQFTRDDSGE